MKRILAVTLLFAAATPGFAGSNFKIVTETPAICPRLDGAEPRFTPVGALTREQVSSPICVAISGNFQCSGDTEQRATTRCE